MATTSSSSGGGGRQNSSSSNSGGNSASHHPGMERTNLLDSPFQSGHLPTIADVRSPDVLHCQDGPCDCLSHTLKVINIVISFGKRTQPSSWVHYPKENNLKYQFFLNTKLYYKHFFFLHSIR